MMYTRTSRTQGFTLIEIAIVLFIVGLVAGVIIGGKVMLRSSQLRAVTSEVQKFAAITNSFVEKYGSLPGDLPNATAYWGTAANCPGDSTQGSTDDTTCNGNGDGRIAASTNSTEHYRFWQHLSAAGLFTGRWSGVTGGAANDYTSIIGLNSPGSKLNNAGYTAYFRAENYAGEANNEYAGYHGNHLRFGKAITDHTTSGSVLTPAEARDIDLKMDEGKPALGKVMARNILACTGSGSETNIDADYDTANDAISCPLTFRRFF